MSGNREKLILEAYRLSEERLQCQQTLALAADARAVNFGVAMFAIAALLAGLSVDSAYQAALLSTSALVVCAGAVAGYSAKPIEFGAPGARYRSLGEDIRRDRPFEDVIEQLGTFNDEAIDENDEAMKANRELMYCAYVMCLCSPILGVLVNLYCAQT